MRPPQGGPSIGKRVAYARAWRGMTQQQLADRLGKSKSWVDKVERGARDLDRLSVLREIARVLQVDLAYLLGVDATTGLGAAA